MKRRIVCWLTLSLFMLAACNSGPSLKNTKTQIYANEAGYHLTLPEDWSLLEERETDTIFGAPENALSLTIVNELGGEAYYGLDEITLMLLDNLSAPEDNSAWQPVRVLTDTETARRQVFRGQDEQEATVYLDITVLQPYPGIRYYLLFAAGAAAYSNNSTLLGDIVANFAVDENVQELYALMKERREAQLTQ